MSQARLPRTEPSTELITAHKLNNCDAHAALQTGDFSALPKHRVRRAAGDSGCTIGGAVPEFGRSAAHIIE